VHHFLQHNQLRNIVCSEVKETGEALSLGKHITRCLDSSVASGKLHAVFRDSEVSATAVATELLEGHKSVYDNEKETICKQIRQCNGRETNPARDSGKHLWGVVFDVGVYREKKA